MYISIFYNIIIRLLGCKFIESLKQVYVSFEVMLLKALILMVVTLTLIYKQSLYYIVVTNATGMYLKYNLKHKHLLLQNLPP